MPGTLPTTNGAEKISVNKFPEFETSFFRRQSFRIFRHADRGVGKMGFGEFLL